jgi:hypothetical protein
MRCRVCGRRRYFSIGRRRTQEALLGYLDGLTRAGGLRPWQEVPEPWQRQAVDDGTWAARADALEMAGGDGTEVAKAVEGLHAYKHRRPASSTT